jgi:murein DD-endopeptidase MepM/ murein hydrolase activator NlpD
MSLRRNPLGLEQLESRDLCAVNPLNTSALPAGTTVEVRDLRLGQDIGEVRVLASQYAGQPLEATRQQLRVEIAEAVSLASSLTTFTSADTQRYGTPVEIVQKTPNLQFFGYNNWEYGFDTTDLKHPLQVLRNGAVLGTIPAGASRSRFAFGGSAYAYDTLTFKDTATGQVHGPTVLVMQHPQTGQLRLLNASGSTVLTGVSLPSLSFAAATPLTSSNGTNQDVRTAIDQLFADLTPIQSAIGTLTAEEYSAAWTRQQTGRAEDVNRTRAAFLTHPGVEAVVTPSLSFQSGWNMTGQHTLTVNGHDLPEGSRMVLASDAGLTQVLDERSVLAGSDSATFLRGSATFVGLVDSAGNLLGSSFSLANENGWLMVRQGGTLVGQPNTTLPATSLAGVLTPVTKDALRSVAPSVRFVTSGSSVDLRYEWLPVGSVITLTNPVDGVVSPPITVTSRTGNLPLYLPAGQARRITLTASDGRQLFRPMGVIRRPDTGQMSFYELDPPANRWVAALDLTSEKTLATREDVRTTEAGRTALTPRLNAVSISADTTSRRNWGAALGEMAGISLSLSEREIARRHLPNLIGATPAEDCTLILAEIDRLTALPGSNSRGWNERFVMSMVSDAYARAREDIKVAWPIFCEMIVAGFQVVQSTRTDAANVTPITAIEQTRNAFVQSGQLLHLLPSAQTILGCLTQHFDRCHAFLAGAATTWQQEVDAASQAGSITRDPNPGLRLESSPQQRAYDTALSAFQDAERLHRQAVTTGVARYISASVVTLEKARVTLQQAEVALRGATTATTPAQLTKQTLENGDVITVMNKTSLQYILAGLPTKIASTQQRLQVVTSATVRASLQAELTHWQTLQTAAAGLLATIPTGQTMPVLGTAQARGWMRYLQGDYAREQQLQGQDGAGGGSELPLSVTQMLQRSFADATVAPAAAQQAAIDLMNTGLSQQTMYAQMTNWTSPGTSAFLSALPSLRSDTAVGSIMRKGLHRVWQASTEQEAWATALSLQVVTDIPAGKIVEAAFGRLAQDAASRVASLLRTAQYGHLFDANETHTSGIPAAAVNNANLTEADTSFRIRFDVSSANRIRYATVSLGNVIVGNSRGKTYVNVDLRQLPTLAPSYPMTPNDVIYPIAPPNTSGLPVYENGETRVGAYYLTLTIVMQDGTTMTRALSPVHVPRLKPEQLRIEEATRQTEAAAEYAGVQHANIFAQMKQYMPVQLLEGATKKWYWLLASGFHDGETGYHAVDLNTTNGNDSDRGQEVRSVAAGILRLAAPGSYSGGRGDLSYGALRIDHAQANGTAQSWQTNYLHLPIFSTGQSRVVTVVRADGTEAEEEREIFVVRKQTGSGTNTDTSVEVWDDMRVEAGQLIGYVGGRESGSEASGFSEGAGNAHLHFEVKVNGAAIDLRQYLTSLVSYVQANDGGLDDDWTSVGNNSRTVTWNADLGAWVNEGDRLILDRSPQQLATSGEGKAQRFLAWHADPAQRVWVMWDIRGFWVKASESSNPVLKWNPLTQEFVAI